MGGFIPNSTTTIKVSEINDTNNTGIVVDEKKHPQEKETTSRFYLPVLQLNSPEYWPSKQLSERKLLTNEVLENTCLKNCCGTNGLKSACCYMDLDDTEHILGPIDENWIREIIKYLRRIQGSNVTRSDVVIDFEEGKLIGERFFGGKEAFKIESNYPMLRLQVTGPRFACKFLNTISGKCTIYEKRPDMCAQYYCEYIKANFLIRTKQHPNSYVKLR